jgi:hypothetical protein
MLPAGKQVDNNASFLAMLESAADSFTGEGNRWHK